MMRGWVGRLIWAIVLFDLAFRRLRLLRRRGRNPFGKDSFGQMD